MTKSWEGTESRCWHHWGSELGFEQGKLTTLRLISWPSSLVLWMVLDKKGALSGVVIMLVFTPRAANSLAMSVIGIMWP